MSAILFFKAMIRGHMRRAADGRAVLVQPYSTRKIAAPHDAQRDLFAQAPAPRRPHVTATPEFRRWFEGSQVVDAAGKPQRVYHGTIHFTDESRRDGIVSFNRRWSIEHVRRAPSLDAIGSWFSSAPNDGGAALYSGSSSNRTGDPTPGAATYPLYLDIKRPLIFRSWHDGERWRDPFDGLSSLWNTYHQHRERAGTLDAQTIKDRARNKFYGDPDGFNAHLRAKGYDGVILRDFREGHESNASQDAFIVLDPGQAKSAIGNRGTFDSGNPDISKAMVRGHIRHAADGAPVLVRPYAATRAAPRLDEPPEKVVTAYKLFRTHPRHPGKLFPLFVHADKPVDIGVWLAAEAGDPGKRAGSVKSKLGDLAYRPGWHAGDLPVATHIGGKSAPDMKAPDHRPDDQVWAEVELPADVDWQAVADARAERNKQGQVIARTAHITDRVPDGGFYRYKTNPNMTGNWLIAGAMRVRRVLSDAEVEAVNAAAGVADLPRRRPT